MNILHQPKALALAAIFAAAALVATAQAQVKTEGQHHKHHRHPHAQQGPTGHGMMMHGAYDFQRFAPGFRDRAERALDRLELTQEQRDRLFELRHSAQPELRAARIEARTHRQALRELARAEKFDKTAAEKASQALAEAQARGHLLRAQLHFDMAQVFTDEQRDQLRTWRKNRAERRGQMRHRAVP